MVGSKIPESFWRSFILSLDLRIHELLLCSVFDSFIFPVKCMVGWWHHKFALSAQDSHDGLTLFMGSHFHRVFVCFFFSFVWVISYIYLSVLLPIECIQWLPILMMSCFMLSHSRLDVRGPPQNELRGPPMTQEPLPSNKSQPVPQLKPPLKPSERGEGAAPPLSPAHSPPQGMGGAAMERVFGDLDCNDNTPVLMPQKHNIKVCLLLQPSLLPSFPPPTPPHVIRWRLCLLLAPCWTDREWEDPSHDLIFFWLPVWFPLWFDLKWINEAAILFASHTSAILGYFGLLLHWISADIGTLVLIPNLVLQNSLEFSLASPYSPWILTTVRQQQCLWASEVIFPFIFLWSLLLSPLSDLHAPSWPLSWWCQLVNQSGGTFVLWHPKLLQINMSQVHVFLACWAFPVCSTLEVVFMRQSELRSSLVLQHNKTLLLFLCCPMFYWSISIGDSPWIQCYTWPRMCELIGESLGFILDIPMQGSLVWLGSQEIQYWGPSGSRAADVSHVPFVHGAEWASSVL